MDDRVLRFRVGVVVVAAAMITMFLITLLGAWPNPFAARNTLLINFPAAPGVAVDTPVRKNGVKIGRVKALELVKRGVRLTLELDASYPIRANDICHIRTGSLVTGDAVLEFVASEDPSLSDEIVQDGDYTQQGKVDASPFEVITKMEGQFRATLESIKTAGDEIGTLARNVNTLLGTEDDQLQGVLRKVETALDNFNQAMTNVNAIVGDEQLRSRLKQSVDKVPRLFDQTEDSLAEFQTTLQKFNAVAARAEHNLANIEELTAPLGAHGEEITQNLIQSVRSANELLANFAHMSRSLQNKDGTIGQLIHNPELYNRLNRTVGEIETLVRKLEPIIDDVRVISDKVARDPGQFGVRGLLDRRPHGAGTKYPVYPEEPSAPRTRLGDLRLESPFR